MGRGKGLGIEPCRLYATSKRVADNGRGRWGRKTQPEHYESFHRKIRNVPTRPGPTTVNRCTRSAAKGSERMSYVEHCLATAKWKGAKTIRYFNFRFVNLNHIALSYYENKMLGGSETTGTSQNTHKGPSTSYFQVLGFKKELDLDIGRKRGTGSTRRAGASDSISRDRSWGRRCCGTHLKHVIKQDKAPEGPLKVRVCFQLSAILWPGSTWHGEAKRGTHPCRGSQSRAHPQTHRSMGPMAQPVCLNGKAGDKTLNFVRQNRWRRSRIASEKRQSDLNYGTKQG